MPGQRSTRSGTAAPRLTDVVLHGAAGTPAALAPLSAFGEGVLTFHINGLFRTPPGWNLWVGGSPNSPKDGIYPLTGVIETDWSPYTFTMNWRFTRRTTACISRRRADLLHLPGAARRC